MPLRVLRQVGFPDDVLLVARHAGADHEAIRGPLGVWRKVRTREDRGRPRFVKMGTVPFAPGTAKEAERRCRECRGQLHDFGRPGARPGAAAAAV